MIGMTFENFLSGHNIGKTLDKVHKKLQKEIIKNVFSILKRRENDELYHAYQNQIKYHADAVKKNSQETIGSMQGSLKGKFSDAVQETFTDEINKYDKIV